MSTPPTRRFLTEPNEARPHAIRASSWSAETIRARLLRTADGASVAELGRVSDAGPNPIGPPPRHVAEHEAHPRGPIAMIRRYRGS